MKLKSYHLLFVCFVLFASFASCANQDSIYFEHKDSILQLKTMISEIAKGESADCFKYPCVNIGILKLMRANCSEPICFSNKIAYCLDSQECPLMLDLMSLSGISKVSIYNPQSLIFHLEQSSNVFSTKFICLAYLENLSIVKDHWKIEQIEDNWHSVTWYETY